MIMELKVDLADGNGKENTCKIHIHTHTHTHTYIYIYISSWPILKNINKQDKVCVYIYRYRYRYIDIGII